MPGLGRRRQHRPGAARSTRRLSRLPRAGPGRTDRARLWSPCSAPGGGQGVLRSRPPLHRHPAPRAPAAGGLHRVETRYFALTLRGEPRAALADAGSRRAGQAARVLAVLTDDLPEALGRSRHSTSGESAAGTHQEAVRRQRMSEQAMPPKLMKRSARNPVEEWVWSVGDAGRLDRWIHYRPAADPGVRIGGPAFTRSMRARGSCCGGRPSGNVSVGWTGAGPDRGRGPRQSATVSLRREASRRPCSGGTAPCAG